MAKVRSVLEMSRMKIPQNAKLWLEAIRFEKRHGEDKLAASLLAKALKECPKSGLLWAEQIYMAPRPEQKAKSLDAINNCDDDPHVITAVAKLLWRSRKIRRARKWFHRAVTIDPDFGDAWAVYYKFELEQADKEGQRAKLNDLIEDCKRADPHHGELWCNVIKKTENAHKQIGELLALTANEVHVLK